MPKVLIEGYPKAHRQAPNDGTPILHISECFSDTIQGEGIGTGTPSTFLRFQNCTLNCIWCDTEEVWRQGNPYTVAELIKIWEDNGVIESFKNGQHLVFTGGSPLRQYKGIIAIVNELISKYGFRPFTEVENECTLTPPPELIEVIDRWNNSPKLNSSENALEIMYRPEILKLLSSFKDSWFKFVVMNEDEWQEIEDKFLTPGLIRKDQVILMPEGATREELHTHYQFAVNMAVKNGVRLTDRLHITIWNKKTGV
jgi:7-carboxy-7-deazaguanine synthase